MDTVATADVTQDFFVNSRLSHYLLICEKRHVRIIYESHRMLHFGSWTQEGMDTAATADMTLHQILCGIHI